MQSDHRHRATAVALVIATLTFAHAAARADDLRPEDEASGTGAAPLVHAGDAIGPDAHGASYVESMDAVVARDLARLEAEAERPAEAVEVHGVWAVPTLRSTRFPHSGARHITNKTGDTSMGIRFPSPVDVHGAYFARQIAPEVTTSGVFVIGYRDGAEVARTAVFRDLDDTPDFSAMDMRNVDRIVIRAEAVINGAGWYALDDLAFSTRPDADAGIEAKRIVLDFEDLPPRFVLTGSDYAGLGWEDGTGVFTRDQDESVPPPVPMPGERDREPGDAPEAVAAGGGGTLPERIIEFQGVIRGDAGSASYPPDSNGAIGPDHYVETVNRNFAVYDRTDGAELVNVLLGSFLPGSNGDPRVLWDQFAGRWIVIVSDFSATASIYLAVSTTDDPTGSWFKTSFVTAAGSDAGCWPDYPTLGLDENGIYTASYMVGCAMTLFAIDKAPLIAPSPSLGAITAFRGLPLEGAVQPAHTFGDGGGEFVVSRSSSTSIRVRQVVGPITAPTLVELGSVSIPSHAPPPDVPALGSSTPLDHTVSHRLMNAVYRNGSIWTCHDVEIGGRSACRWYEIDATSLATEQVGTVDSATLHYFYASIAVNAQDDVAMGFSGSNADQYAACYYTGRLASDSPGQMATPALFRVGEAAQNNIDGFGRNRWGDYSLTTVDPSDDLSFWSIQEYAHADNIWGTWIIQLRGELAPLVFSYPDGRPPLIAPSGASIRVAIAGQDGTVLDPASPTLHYDAGGGFVTTPMALVSAGLYDAVFPPIPCGTEVSYYVSAATQTAEVRTDPPDAPFSSYSALSAVDITTAFEDDFEADLGWSAENLGATSGDWQRGIPVNDAGWDYDPVTDGDGSGRCFLTQNELGNTDVDNGAVRLTSPSLDLTGGGVTLAYEYYLRLTDAAGGVDRLLVEANGAGGVGPWTVIATHATDGGLSWRHHEITQAELEAAGLDLTGDVRVRFTANDADPQSIVEAGVDGVRVTALVCDGPLAGDVDGDGDVDFQDLLMLLSNWGDCPVPPAECPADFDGNGSVGFSDLLALLSNWT